MRELPISFQGKGEVKGYTFSQKAKSDKAYIYYVYSGDEISHFEVFEHRVNTRFNCVTYPKSNMFGIWAWCFVDEKKAWDKFNSLSEMPLFD
jgi:hypothetical protein